MFSIEKCAVPADIMLDKYSSITGAYVDSYITEVPGQVSFSEFILAFYTTPLFKLERLILKLFVFKPSTDAQVNQLANGEIDKFAAWTVENRSENELMMCDFLGRTRSWFMVKDNGKQTQLHFGSAVVPKTGETSLDFGFRALLGFHQIYSVLLLYFARSRIMSQLSKTT